MKNKVKIREEILIKLQDFDASEKARQTSAILSKLILSKNFAEAATIGLYMNTSIEFDLSVLFAQTNKRILIPKTLPKRGMTFIKFDENNLTRTKFGLMEPMTGEAEIPDLIIVPGLVWNAAGYRVGFGGGYYDRYLANFKGHTLSLVYDFQRLDFEPEAFDIAVKEIFSV